MKLVYFPREENEWVERLRRLYGDRVEVVERARDLSVLKRASILLEVEVQ